MGSQKTVTEHPLDFQSEMCFFSTTTASSFILWSRPGQPRSSVVAGLPRAGRVLVSVAVTLETLVVRGPALESEEPVTTGVLPVAPERRTQFIFLKG